MTGTELLSTDDGRQLAVELGGPAGGPVVVLCHPAPGSRRFDPDPAATRAAGVRLLTVDRPGYGGSTPFREMPSIVTAADDIALVLRTFGIRSAAVAGWSAGGRIAMALAARHPELVTSVALLATPAPDDAVPWYGEQARGLIEMLRPSPQTAVERTAELLKGQAADPEAAIEVLASSADAELLRRAGVREAVVQMLREGFRQGSVGVASDIVSYTLQPWGFEPGDVGVGVSCWYGAGDTLTPPEHGEWWAAQVKHSSLHVVPEAGHLVPIAAWADVLAELLSSGV